MRVEYIYRYPIKGLTAEALEEAEQTRRCRAALAEIAADPEGPQRMGSWSGKPPSGESLLDVALRVVGWLATVDGPRCLPDGRDIFWESDSQPRVVDFGTNFIILAPDAGIRWVFFLTAAEPSTIRQIVLLPADIWRAGPTALVVPLPLKGSTTSSPGLVNAAISGKTSFSG